MPYITRRNKLKISRDKTILHQQLKWSVVFGEQIKSRLNKADS